MPEWPDGGHHEPTATQRLAEAHETPSSSAPETPASRAGVTTFHVPERKISVNGRGAAPPWRPTAAQKVEVGQDTDVSSLVAAGSGTVTRCQAPPVSVSTKAWRWVPEVRAPTAVHEVGPVQEMLWKPLPAGPGADCWVQVGPAAWAAAGHAASRRAMAALRASMMTRPRALRAWGRVDGWVRSESCTVSSML